MPFYKICVFSDVKGRVVMDGKPVAGATVQRSYDAGSIEAKGSDSALTDANGRFSFPAIWLTSFLAWTSANPKVQQEIYIEHDGKRYLAYELEKGGYRLDSELLRNDIKPGDGDPLGVKIRLLCDLNASPSRKIFAGFRKLEGICAVVRDDQL